MHAWSFAVFARKLSLQALRQKRRRRWWWQTRPSFPPQFAQRFSNLVNEAVLRFGGWSRDAVRRRRLERLSAQRPRRAQRGPPGPQGGYGHTMDHCPEAPRHYAGVPYAGLTARTHSPI